MAMRKRPVGRRAAVAADRGERRNAVVEKPATPPTARGLKSRERIKQAAAGVLERTGYRAMRLSDIAVEAGVNVSLIYHYFSGKADITSEVLTTLLDEQRRRDAIPRSTSDDAFEAILRANRYVAETYARHPGLMRCLLHFDEEEAEFSALYRRASHEWNQRVASDIARRCPDAPVSEAERMMIAAALGGMVDNFLFELYVNRDPVFRENFKTSEDAALFLAIVWYRAVYLQNPPPARLGPYAGLSQLGLRRGA